MHRNAMHRKVHRHLSVDILSRDPDAHNDGRPGNFFSQAFPKERQRRRDQSLANLFVIPNLYVSYNLRSASINNEKKKLTNAVKFIAMAYSLEPTFILSDYRTTWSRYDS